MTARVTSSTNIAWWHRFSAPTGDINGRLVGLVQRRSLATCLVGPVDVVVSRVLGQDLPKVLLAVDQQVVQALAAQCSDEPLGKTELTATIGTFIDHWNDHPRPFTWTKDADEILTSIQRAKTKTNSLSHH
jgi:hypothetical protein